MIDLTVMLKNVPGKLANIGEILGKNGINMEGITGFSLKDEFSLHILVEDDTKARSILEQEGYQISASREVIVLSGQPGTNILGKPGTGGKIARQIGNAGVNIDLEKAKAALK